MIDAIASQVVGQIGPIQVGDRAATPFVDPGGETPGSSRPVTDPGGETSAFSTRLQDAMRALEATAAQSDATSEAMIAGEVDIHEAMVAMEKADLVLRIAGTVRNKVIDAYQQLMQAAGA